MIGMLKKGTHPALSAVCKEVDSKENVSGTIGLMWQAMYQGKGCGLAANQIGEDRRIIVIHANGFKQVIVNPVITKSYGGRVISKEGCLSFPGVTAKVMRHKQIIVEGFDQDWKPVKRKLKGLAAYCVQHEVDHLNGKTIVSGRTK